jgi:hypothetical protein
MELISQQKLELEEEIKYITVFASPSKIASLKPWDTAKEIAKRVDFASPTKGEHERSEPMWTEIKEPWGLYKQLRETSGML